MCIHQNKKEQTQSRTQIDNLEHGQIKLVLKTEMCQLDNTQERLNHLSLLISTEALSSGPRSLI